MDKKPRFEFGKKLGIHESAHGDSKLLLDAIARLLQCMKETNFLHKKDCEFFRLDFRPAEPFIEERFPHGALVLDLKWGCKEE